MIWAHKTSAPRWVVAPEPDAALVSDLTGQLNLPANVVKILVNRHLDSPELINQFLNPQMTDLKDPFTMTGMQSGIERVVKAFSRFAKLPMRPERAKGTSKRRSQVKRKKR